MKKHLILTGVALGLGLLALASLRPDTSGGATFVVVLGALLANIIGAAVCARYRSLSQVCPSVKIMDGLMCQPVGAACTVNGQRGTCQQAIRCTCIAATSVSGTEQRVTYRGRLALHDTPGRADAEGAELGRIVG